jgi:hypothetical protein
VQKSSQTIGQLNQENTAITSQTQTQEWQEFDGVGNCQTVTTWQEGKSARTQEIRFNCLNQISAITFAPLPQYDNNGNTLGPTSLTTYDAWNRMVSSWTNNPVRDAQTGNLVDQFTTQYYVYDALGRRIQQWTQINTRSFPRVTSFFDVAGNDIQDTVAGRLQFQFVWSPVGTKLLIERDSDYDSRTNGLQTRVFAQEDAQNSVTGTLQNGAIVERYLYSGYGSVTVVKPDFSDFTGGEAGKGALGWQYLFQGALISNGNYGFNDGGMSPSSQRWNTPLSNSVPDDYVFENDNPFQVIPSVTIPNGGPVDGSAADYFSAAARLPFTFGNATSFAADLNLLTGGVSTQVLSSRQFGAAYDSVDQTVAGFASGLTAGLSTRARTALWGDDATRNHQGTLFTVGQTIGTLAGLGLAFVNPCAMVSAVQWGYRGLQVIQGVGGAINAVQNFQQQNYWTAGLDALGVLGNVSAFLRACFTGETELLARGPWGTGWKRIDEIAIDDEVLSRDEHNVNGQLAWKKVEETFKRLGRICHLHVGGKVIRTTGEHPFWVYDKGWINASELQSGHRVSSHDGQWVTVEEVYDTGEYETVYNLRVADWHTYFVGSESWGFSAWSHNQCVPSGDYLSTPNRLTDKLAAWKAYSSANPGASLATWSKQYDVIRTNYQVGKWREAVSMWLNGGQAGSNIATPLGTRIPDVVLGSVYQEIKNGYTVFDSATRFQMGKDFFLSNRGFLPEWHFYGGASQRVIDKLSTYGIPFFFH